MSKWDLVFETPADIEIREDAEKEKWEWEIANYGDSRYRPMTDEDWEAFFEAFSEDMYSDPMEWEWEL